MAEKNILKSVWISTVPRVGSMWIFNVTRRMLRYSDYTVLPEKVPQSDSKMMQLARETAWRDPDPARIWVLKVHAQLQRNLPHSKIITCVRDPRDIIISFRRFMNTSFDHALKAASALISMTNAYRKYSPDLVFIARYEDIESCPVKLVLQLASFLNLDIPENAAYDITEEFSRGKVENLIHRKTVELDMKIMTRAPIDDREVVVISRDNFRAFDTNTGFQTGHVSSYKTGDWRIMLTEQEKMLANSTLGGWLQENGYPPD